jgi:hypothetical protein
VEAFTAAARSEPEDALRHARSTLAYAGAIGISNEYLRWAWPLAVRAAFDLHDTATTGELFTLLDACQPGYLASMLRAERDLAHGLLDHAQHLRRLNDAEAAAAAIGEARMLAERLRCQPLLDRAATITSAKSPAQA